MIKPTVKARAHYGTSSLDLTIPSKIVKDNKIQEGDVFSIEIKLNRENQLIIKYTRIFKQ